jgi:hypothetical protein
MRMVQRQYRAVVPLLGRNGRNPQSDTVLPYDVSVVLHQRHEGGSHDPTAAQSLKVPAPHTRRAPDLQMVRLCGESHFERRTSKRNQNDPVCSFLRPANNPMQFCCT